MMPFLVILSFPLQVQERLSRYEMSAKWSDILGFSLFVIFSCYMAYMTWFKPEEYKRKTFGDNPSKVDCLMMTDLAMWLWRIMSLILFIASVVIVIAFVILFLKAIVL
jgi:hypothetical protein